MTSSTDDIHEVVADLAQSCGAGLRDKVAAVWSEALITGCGDKGVERW